jgi:hypothetical protein
MSDVLGNLRLHIAQMAPHQKERAGGQLLVQAALRIAALENGVTRVAIECNCRAEHGAEGAEHLLEIEKMLLRL